MNVSLNVIRSFQELESLIAQDMSTFRPEMSTHLAERRRLFDTSLQLNTDEKRAMGSLQWWGLFQRAANAVAIAGLIARYTPWTAAGTVCSLAGTALSAGAQWMTDRNKVQMLYAQAHAKEASTNRTLNDQTISRITGHAKAGMHTMIDVANAMNHMVKGESK